MVMKLYKNDSIGIGLINFVSVIFHSKMNYDLVA